MKPAFALPLAAALLAGLLAGCGQPGPLYMPKPPQAPAAKPAPAQPAAAPAPVSSSPAPAQQ